MDNGLIGHLADPGRQLEACFFPRVLSLDRRVHYRGSIIGGRTFRKPPYFVPSKPQTAFVFF